MCTYRTQPSIIYQITKMTHLDWKLVRITGELQYVVIVGWYVHLGTYP